MLIVSETGCRVNVLNLCCRKNVLPVRMETNEWSLVESDRTVLCSRCRAAHDRWDLMADWSNGGHDCDREAAGRSLAIRIAALLQGCLAQFRNLHGQTGVIAFQIRPVLIDTLVQARNPVVQFANPGRNILRPMANRICIVFHGFSSADIIPFGNPVLWATILRRPLSDFGSGYSVCCPGCGRCRRAPAWWNG